MVNTEILHASGLQLQFPAPARLARTGEVLDLVRRRQAGTTSELADVMGLARSTVAERVDLLLGHRLLIPSIEATPRRGRPPTVFVFNARAGVTLAAQVGMSGARVAVTDLDGGVLWSQTVQMKIERGPEVVLAKLEKEFDRALAEIGETRVRVHGIGVGVPGQVELATAGDPGDSAYRPWIDFPITAHLTAAFGVPVFVDRDVSLLAMGEHRAFWPDAESYLCVKVGTVIGCGIVTNGSLVRGSDGVAGQIGHTQVSGSDADCACGNRGCLNAIAGGAALARRLELLGHQAVGARDVARLAQSNVPDAVQAVRNAGRDIGRVLADLINVLNPQVVSFWGYLADAEQPFLAGMRESIYRYAVPAATAHLKLERARLGDDAGILGAAMMVVEHTLQPAAVDRYVTEVALPA